MAPHDPNPGRRFAVGYVSPDFRRHSVAFFIEALLANTIPPWRGLLLCRTWRGPDAVTARLESLRAPLAVRPCALARAVASANPRRPRIDILVDLAGHTTGKSFCRFFTRAPRRSKSRPWDTRQTSGLAAHGLSFIVTQKPDPAATADAFCDRNP